jgi:hypothetical protein
MSVALASRNVSSVRVSFFWALRCFVVRGMEMRSRSSLESLDVYGFIFFYHIGFYTRRSAPGCEMDRLRRDAFTIRIRAATREARHLLSIWREMTDDQHEGCIEDVQELALLVAELELKHSELPFTWTDFFLVSIFAGSIVCFVGLMKYTYSITEL